MRVLVITQGNNSLYGASTSLGHLLRNCDWVYDIVYTRYLKKKYHVTCEEMREYCGRNVKNVYRIFLPFESNVVAHSSSAYKSVRYFLYRFLIFIESFKLRKIMKSGRYDYILLNSIVLYPIIRKNYKFVCYVREACYATGNNLKRITKKLNEADKLVFIDPILQKYLPDVKAKRLVINNPFDMSCVGNISMDEIERLFPEIDQDKIIISIIGQIIPVKGVLFAVNAVKKVVRKDIIFLIVGKGNEQKYINMCMDASLGSKQIFFLGEQKEMKFIYRMTDYVLRADDIFCTGRTVYEGLYSGCRVIIQSDKDDDKTSFQEYEEFKDRIFFYETRNESSLIDVLESLPTNKCTDRQYKSNVGDYVRRVSEFLEKE